MDPIDITSILAELVGRDAMLGATQSPDPIAREMAAFNRATGLSASMDLTPPSVTGPVQPTVYSLPNDKPIISLDDEPDETEDEWWKDLGAAGQMDDEPDALRWPNAPELLTDLDDGEAKVSTDDTTSGFLEDKLVGGDGITISTTGGGGDEKVNISMTTQTNVLLDGSNHSDTLSASVVRGDVMIGNSTPKWSRLAAGTSTDILLTSDGTDVAWRTPTGHDPWISLTLTGGVLDINHGGPGAECFCTACVVDQISIDQFGHVRWIQTNIDGTKIGPLAP